MRQKLYWGLSLLLLLVLIMTGCGGGGGSSGGSSSTAGTFVGTWNRISFAGTESAFPEQFIFNANGTGSFSGAASGNATFTWAHTGTQLSITPQGGATQVLTAPAVGTVGNAITVTTSTGGTANYNRA